MMYFLNLRDQLVAVVERVFLDQKVALHLAAHVSAVVQAREV